MRWVGIIALLCMAAFFGLLAVGHTLQVDEAREVWANGKAVEGTLTAQFSRKKGPQEYSYAYVVDGAEIAAERRSIPGAAASIPVGTKLVVRYDLADPQKSMTAAELRELEHWGNRALLPLIAFAFLAGAITVAVRGRRKPPPT